jgi:hypothetical protein
MSKYLDIYFGVKDSKYIGLEKKHDCSGI